jgi:DNA/RNA-binding domain of Phe-tRNA-synthetase-like protein
MTPVIISDELKASVPHLLLSCIECDVSIKEDNITLWGLIDKKSVQIRDSVQLGDISRMPAVAASRRGYKLCGNDPARYRLSAEALLRRTVQGKGLYRVNNVVDLLNLVSLSTGFSIGGYDAEKIEGEVVFGIGRQNEPYTGIGRGELNIESLPVFRDNKGPFGTPTSDSVRTSVTSGTIRFLMIIIDFGTQGILDEATVLATEFLRKFAGAKNIEIARIGE